jgi:intracellular sulfur oxidation DsrE/DsrF family protein
MSPHGLLSMLVADGVTTQVCAIYLPNSAHAAEDLIEGVSVATPPEIAAVMTAPQTRLFTF